MPLHVYSASYCFNLSGKSIKTVRSKKLETLKMTCNVNESISEVLREYKRSSVQINQSESILPSDDSVEKIQNHIKQLITEMNFNIPSIEYASLNKILAICCLEASKEIDAVYHLIESHAVVLRQQVQHRFLKTEFREEFLNEPQTYGLNPAYLKFDVKSSENCALLKARLSELPKEWYMIQVTVQYEPPGHLKCNDSTPVQMHPIHITILPTGCSAIEPFCVTIPKPNTNTDYDVCNEIRQILSSNKFDLEASYANNQLYWKMRKRQNNKMKAAITELESTWLREWRILFMADPLDNLDLVKDLHDMIDKLIADDKSSKNISDRTRWLLRKIVVGACYLTKAEIAMAVKYVLSDNDKLAGNIILSIYGKLKCIEPLQSAKRMTLVLIIDENMDYIPFETMEVLKIHPVTRFPSFHIAYALFKEHESSIKEGCKVIKVTKDIGTFIVNPSGNLSKMEKRMKLFIEYWLPHWKGSYNVEPEEESFEEALVNHDILMYNGHGSGIQYLSGEKIEKLRIRAIVFLFGCGSVKLLPVGGRYPPYGVSNQYLIACSSCVLGMLWEVTDGDVDRMTTSFISNWIPSPAERPWTDVDINKWSNGVLKFEDKKTKAPTSVTPMEPEMLRAIAMSKEVCLQYMTAAAIVVRGLPIKLE